jgi:hypothetical protein
LSSDEGLENLILDKKKMLESIDLMQKHNSDVLIQEEDQRFNRLEREEVMPR